MSNEQAQITKTPDEWCWARECLQQDIWAQFGDRARKRERDLALGKGMSRSQVDQQLPWIPADWNAPNNMNNPNNWKPRDKLVAQALFERGMPVFDRNSQPIKF